MAEKPWEIFLRPVPKEKVFEVDVGGLLSQFMEKEGGAGENSDTNFQAAGLVIQGATHTWARKVDVLHGEVMAAVSNLADEDEETAEGGEKKTRKKKSGPDYKSILGSSNFTI